MASPEVVVSYTIADSTPHSGRYTPENIFVDKPQDQGSRWSGAHQGSAKQWLLLRLESPAILKRISFGKFNKPHPCNVKEFKLYIGLAPENMTQVLHSGLKNNAEQESFEIGHVNSAGVEFPTQYVKIEPLSAHGQSFHVSIWHISFKGISDTAYVEKATAIYEEHRETSVLRHILKHLRQRRLLTPFQSIVERSGIQLENPLITRLHESLVLQGDWEHAESLLLSLSDANLFTEYLYSCQPHAMWKRLTGTDADGDVPSPRGGHAMCLDPENELVYLFGGWDGRKSLDDFWVYSIREDRWKILSHSTMNEPNAPGPRSCHKMVFDIKTGNIYVLGRLDDSGVRMPAAGNGRIPVPATTTVTAGPVAAQMLAPNAVPYIMQQSPLRQQFIPGSSQSGVPMVPSSTNRPCSEFYRYQTRGIDAGKWVFLSIDTASSGGPPLVFDHQMVIDSDAQILYVSGGRIIDGGDWETAKCAGLYSYNVRISKWKLLQHPDPAPGSPTTIPHRFGHSMVFEPKAKQLYIFGGQRDEKYVSDMYVYDIPTNTTTELFSNFTAAGGPDPCFTQRAVLDPLLKEIYIFCGLTRNPSGSSKGTVLRSSPSNWIYRYDTRPGKWYQIHRHPDSPPTEIPLPRFAHQAVYHAPSRMVFLHGGNAGGLSGIEPVSSSGSSSNGADGSRRTSPSPPGEAPGPEQQQQQRVSQTQAELSQSGSDQRLQEASEPAPKEKRLDDFWSMELRRPSVEEVVRQAKFHIRRQQFREMCEQEPPVKALQFLQNEVSSVVDHKDTTEAETFRSLLTHLLSPSHSSFSTRLLGDSEEGFDSSDGSAASSSSRNHSNSRERLQNPRKRQRRRSREISDNGDWTNQLPGEGDEENYDDEMGGLDSDGDIRATFEGRGTAETLRGIIDPIEMHNPAKKSSSAVAGGGGGIPSNNRDRSAALNAVSLTSDRYKQRMEVFNSLLKFVSEGQKEPVGDLLDLVNREGFEEALEGSS